MTFRIASARSRQWATVQWLIFSLWAFAAFEIVFAFVVALVGGNEEARANLPVILLLLVICLPVTLWFARRFMIDALYYRKRTLTFSDGELLVRDALWLDGLHAIPACEIAGIRLPCKDQIKGRGGRLGILDLSARAPLRNLALIEFSRPLTFERKSGPILFDMVFTFLDPGSGESRKAMLVEVAKLDRFLEAAHQNGLPVAR